MFGFVPSPYSLAHPQAHYLGWVIGLEAKPSEEKPMRATSLSSSETSREGSRAGSWSPLGCWPLPTVVVMCDDGWNRVSSPPENSDTPVLAGTGSKLLSSCAAPARATAKASASCHGRVRGRLGAKQKPRDTTNRVRAFPLYRLAQTATVMGKY